jgi:hypothetical protein
MGIRIHKTLGYGLTDVATEGGRITDPRINSDSCLLDETKASPGGYAGFLERMASEGNEDARMEIELVAMTAKEKEVSPSSLCVRAIEGGLPNVLLVRPVGFPHWYRYDDPIDFQEEVMRDGHPDPRVVEIDGGIYPWVGTYMDVRTGERVDSTAVSIWRQIAHGDMADEEKGTALDRIAQVLGYADHAEAQRFVAPVVPPDVRYVCDWGGLFTGPDVWRQLRPLLYVYWA